MTPEASTLRDMAQRPKSKSPFRLDFTPMARHRRYAMVTQRQLAAAVGVHPMSIWRTERNRHEPTVRLMVGVSKALGIPIHELYEVVEDVA